MRILEKTAKGLGLFMPSHGECRRFPFKVEQLFQLVADVEKYPEFLPWCVGARTLECRDNEMLVELAIGYKLLRERYTSRVILQPNHSIYTVHEKGPFRRLVNQWRFNPLESGTCQVDFYVEFEFRSPLLQMVMQQVFEEAIQKMLQAFEDRAKALYQTDENTP